MDEKQYSQDANDQTDQADQDRRRPVDQDETRPFAVFMNAGSGNHEEGSVEQTVREAIPEARLGPFFQFSPGEDFHPMLRKALAWCEEHEGILLLAGGDGTVSTAMPEIVRHSVPIAVLPLGTFNYFARSHHISTEPVDALEQLLKGRPRRVQVCYLNDRPFVIMASMGLYSKVIEARERHKGILWRSRFIALVSGIVTMLRERKSLRANLVLDGHPLQVRTPMVFVSINRFQLETLQLEEVEKLALGRMGVLIMRPVSFWEMLMLMFQGALGRLQEAENLEHLSAERLEFHSGRGQIKVAIDGELAYFQDPLRFRVEQDAVTLIVPPEDEPE